MEILIDFDGTCVEHAYPNVGAEIGAAYVLKRLVAAGHKLILFTMRSGKELDDAVEWFTSHGIRLYGVNRNDLRDEWTSSPKPYGDLIIDDTCLGMPLLQTSGRPYVDWGSVTTYLETRRIIPKVVLDEEEFEKQGDSYYTKKGDFLIELEVLKKGYLLNVGNGFIKTRLESEELTEALNEAAWYIQSYLEMDEQINKQLYLP